MKYLLCDLSATFLNYFKAGFTPIFNNDTNKRIRVWEDNWQRVCHTSGETRVLVPLRL